MPYEYFFPERRAIAEARQRVEHRMDQLVTGGAAGALVFSIPFLDRFAGKSPVRTWLLSAAWATLLVCLLLSLVSTFLSRRAFDAFLAEFDWAPPPPPMPQRRDG